MLLYAFEALRNEFSDCYRETSNISRPTSILLWSTHVARSISCNMLFSEVVMLWKMFMGRRQKIFSLFHDFLPLFRENLWLMLTWVTDGNIDQWTPRTKSFPGEGYNLQTVVGILVKARERCGEITAEYCRISQIFSLFIVNLYLVTSDYALLKFFRHWQPRKFDAVGASRTSCHVARRALRHWNFSIRFTQGCSFKVLTGLATVHFSHGYT